MIRLRLTSKGCCGGHRLKIVTLDGLSPSLASCASLSLSRTCNLSMRYESSYVSCCTIKPGNYSAICTWYGTFGVREEYINRWGSSAIVWFYWGVNENNLVYFIEVRERERRGGGQGGGEERERGRKSGEEGVGGAGRGGREDDASSSGWDAGHDDHVYRQDCTTGSLGRRCFSSAENGEVETLNPGKRGGSEGTVVVEAGR